MRGRRAGAACGRSRASGAGGAGFSLPGLTAVLVLAWRCGRQRTWPGGALLPALPHAAGLGSLAWTALKVGALSFGGGFVIVPLMQSDAVSRYHWMTGVQFLDAVALGQVTPGAVVCTVAVVGYAAGGFGAGLLAAGIAFAPSFVFVLAGRRHFDRLRRHDVAQAFLEGEAALALGARIPG